MANPRPLAVRKVKGKFIVDPGIITVYNTEILVWTGYGTDIEVDIPKSKKQPAHTGNPNEVSWTVDTTLDPPGEYPYKVKCKVDGTYAEGGSDPKIIIR